MTQTNIEKSGKEIYLSLKNRGGSVEHYFHFLLGFLVPLILPCNVFFISALVQNKIINKKSNKIYIRSCNIMDRHILDINFKYIEIIDKNMFKEKNIQPEPRRDNPRMQEYIECWGYDDPEYYDYSVFHSAKLILSSYLSVDINNHYSFFEKNTIRKNGKNIVLINREAAHPFYNSDCCEIKSAGTRRRSIPNFSELSNAISMEYINTISVTLEEKSISYQIALFKHADIIIAQHGAALANLIWCRPNTTLIEIYPLDMSSIVNKKDLFGNLAKCMNIKYVRVNQKNEHSDIGINSILSAIQEPQKTNRILHRLQRMLTKCSSRRAKGARG